MDNFKVTIPSANVPTTLTNKIVYVDLSDLDPSDSFWNMVKASGGDIRVYNDGSNVQVPRHVIRLDTVANTGAIRFLADSISDTANTTFRVEYDGTSADLAVGDPNGRNAVYTAQEINITFNEDPTGTAPQFIDNTGNGYDGAVTGGISQVTGKVGNAVNLNVVDEKIDLVGSGVIGDTGNIEVGFWLKPDITFDSSLTMGRAIVSSYKSKGGWQISWDHRGYMVIVTGSDGVVADTIGTLSSLNAGQWYHIVMQIEDNTANHKIIVDGVDYATNKSVVTLGSSQYPIRVGTRADTATGILEASVDDLYISTILRSLDEISFDYNNTNNPSTFYTLINSQVLASGTVKFNDVNFSNGVVDFFSAPSPTGTLTLVDSDVAITSGVASMTVERDPLKDYFGVARGMTQDFTGTLASAPAGNVISTGLNLTGVNIGGANDDHYIFRATGGTGAGTEVTVKSNTGGDITVTDASAFALGTEFTLGRFVRGISRVFPKD